MRPSKYRTSYVDLERIIIRNITSFARRWIVRRPAVRPSFGPSFARHQSSCVNITSRASAAASGQRRRRRIISCAPHPLLPRRNIATCPTGDMNANNAGGAAPAGGGAPPVAPAYACPPLVVEAKPYYFVIGANLPPPFEVDPLGTKTMTEDRQTPL